MTQPAAIDPRSKAAARLYLDLVKKCLTNTIYGEHEYRKVDSTNPLKRLIDRVFNAAGVTLVRSNTFVREDRENGLDWPPFAHTMVGMRRLDNIQSCVEEILESRVPGDLIETGVWRGGVTIFMRAILAAYGVEDRTVWVADSFRGLPPPDPSRYPADSGDRHHEVTALSIPCDEVRENFSKYGLLDSRVRFLEGWFRDTLPAAPISRLALMRLDGDMYESTMDALVNLYPKLSPGGYVIVDDFNAVEACRRAVGDYRSAHNITEPIRAIDDLAVYWRRSFGA